MYTGLQVKYRLFLLDFNKTWIFWHISKKTLKYEISRKLVQWESTFPMPAVGQINMTELLAVYRKIWKAPEKNSP
jgi:hypothetical protein